MPSYTLDELQTEFFKDTCDILRSARPFASDANSEIELPDYAAAYTDVPFAFQATEFQTKNDFPLGQLADQNIFTRDVGYFHGLQDIKGMDIIKLTTVLDDGTDHPNKGVYYRVVGDPEVRIRFDGNYRFVRFERVDSPPEVA